MKEKPSRWVKSYHSKKTSPPICHFYGSQSISEGLRAWTDAPKSRREGPQGIRTWILQGKIVDRAFLRAPAKVVAEASDLEQIFSGLVKNWREATRSYSLNMRRYAHPTYQALMHALGKEDDKDVVPLILRELQQRPDMWFEALKVLTKENPAMEAKTFEDAVRAWLDWGKQKEYIT